MVIRPHQVVGAGLGRGVRRVGRVRRGFLEQSFRAEAAVDLVGRDVQEAEPRAGVGLERVVVATRDVEQRERPDDICLDERRGTIDRSVDVGLRREVAQHGRPVVAKHGAHRVTVGDVGTNERDPGMIGHARQALETAGVCQLVDDDHANRRLGEELANEVGADEPGAAGHNPNV